MPHAGVACITILEKEQERLVRLYDQMKVGSARAGCT